MNDNWHMQVFEGERLIYEADLTGPAEIGRQEKTEDKPPFHKLKNQVNRVVIAPLEENTISRKHLEVRPLPDERMYLCNKSDKQVVSCLSNNRELKPGESFEVFPPVTVRLGSRTLRLHYADANPLLSLPQSTAAPGRFSSLADLQASITKSGTFGKSTAQMTAWMETFLGLLQSAAGSEDFYVKAARALVDLVQLDSGRVMILTGQKWQENAVHARASLRGKEPSSRILSTLVREKKTVWKVPDSGAGSSVQELEAVVAAPILDRHGAVIGALYGERRLDGPSRAHGAISELDAKFVEVLAMGVAAGLARLELEQAALRSRLQMEQFFTPMLAGVLVDHPEMLQGRASDVSILFCDIRGFSRISEKLGPARTVEWIADVMGVLSVCVLEQEGVVVDYIGDELMAMWGAPQHQPNHAALACRAALAMLERLPQLNETWQPILQENLGVGIGINSGSAQVGNVGSKVKFKYGPLGNTVNLASRVQGATKYLKTPLLITAATHAGLDDSFASRRLCQVGVVNIAQPVTLYELAAAKSAGWLSLKQAYEQALADFDNKRFREACRGLGRIIPDHPSDSPALILLSRAVACLVEDPDPFDPVWQLPGK